MDPPKASLQTIFCAALEITDAHARAAYLDEVCLGDVELRQHINRLLAADSQAGGFLGEPPDAIPPR